MASRKRSCDNITDDHESYMEKINTIAIQWWFLANIATKNLQKQIFGQNVDEETVE